MIINKKNKIRDNKTKLSNKFFKYYFFLTIGLFFLFIFILFGTGYTKNYQKTFLDKFYKRSYNNYLKIPYIIPQAIYGFFIKIPTLQINISLNDHLILEKDRINLLKKNEGKGMTYEFTKVNGFINYKKENLKIDIRLKGDRKIHFLEQDKSSYKIKIDNNKTIMGVNKFSLIKPRARNYIHEWLYHQLMKEGNLITLKYEFVKLKINGESQGLYVLEEGFDKILIERNKKRNGPIFSLKEEWSFGETDRTKKDKLFEVYNKKNWLSEENIEQTLIANDLLNNFFNNDVENLEILFDIDKWAWFMAISDINYYAHGTDVKSVRFYFNPLSAKFEPIPYDGHRTVVDSNINIIGLENLGNKSPSFEKAIECRKNIENCNNLFHYKFFFKRDGSLNKVFFDKYKENINKISSKDFLDNFFKERSKQIYKINAKIYGDYFYVDNILYYGKGLYFFDKEEIYKRGNRLKSKISNIPANILISQNKNRINIKNWNITNDTVFTNHNLNIKKIFCKNILDNQEKIFDLSYDLVETDQNITFTQNISNEIKCENVLIIDKISNAKFIISIDQLNKEYKVTIDRNLGNFKDYFDFDNKDLRLKNKQTIIDKNIIIPKGYIVRIIPGEEIILINNSFIISDSAFYVSGNNMNNQIIKIGGKKENKGGGIFIKNTDNDNFFQNVKFEYLEGDLKNLSLSKYSVYGSLNFFNSKVKLKNFQMKNIYSEDAINIVSSVFSLKNGIFDTISSDAIDVDYSTGNINDLRLNNILNDALDFSESYANISNVYFENIGDKAISVGENSTTDINNLNILNSYLGIASKDGSKVNAQNIKISNVTIPFASYKKKNEYEIPKLKVKEIIYEGYKILYLKDKTSKLEIDNEIKNKITRNILDIVYNPSQKIY